MSDVCIIVCSAVHKKDHSVESVEMLCTTQRLYGKTIPEKSYFKRQQWQNCLLLPSLALVHVISWALSWGFTILWDEIVRAFNDIHHSSTGMSNFQIISAWQSSIVRIYVSSWMAWFRCLTLRLKLTTMSRQIQEAGAIRRWCVPSSLQPSFR